MLVYANSKHFYFNGELISITKSTCIEIYQADNVVVLNFMLLNEQRTYQTKFVYQEISKAVTETNIMRRLAGKGSDAYVGRSSEAYKLYSRVIEAARAIRGGFSLSRGEYNSHELYLIDNYLRFKGKLPEVEAKGRSEGLKEQIDKAMENEVEEVEPMDKWVKRLASLIYVQHMGYINKDTVANYISKRFPTPHKKRGIRWEEDMRTMVELASLDLITKHELHEFVDKWVSNV